jgi:hypothetical protein
VTDEEVEEEEEEEELDEKDAARIEAGFPPMNTRRFPSNVVEPLVLSRDDSASGEDGADNTVGEGVEGTKTGGRSGSPLRLDGW